jgi:hypothetical protein
MNFGAAPLHSVFYVVGAPCPCAIADTVVATTNLANLPRSLTTPEAFGE